MAKFEIVSTRRAADPNLTEFVLQMERGSLAAGDVFYCYETHHSVKVMVLSVEARGESLLITADTDGLNVRSEPRTGSVIGNLPRIKPPNGLIVHVIGESADGGWVQIDRGETTGGETPFAGRGWISGNMLGLSAKSSDSSGAKLYETSAESKVVATLPNRTAVTIAGCDGKMVRVNYKDATGWLTPGARCANPAGRCD